MAKKHSEKSNYPSRYSPSGWVTPQQYIAELLCEQKAKKFGTGELPIGFWSLQEWADYFKSQLRAISKLLKTYSAKAVIITIKEKRLYTLRPAWVQEHIAAKEKSISSSTSVVPNPVVLREEIVENPIVRKTEDRILGKFGDLD